MDHKVHEDKRESLEQCKIQFGSHSRSCKPEVKNHSKSYGLCMSNSELVLCVCSMLYFALQCSLTHALQLVCSELWCIDDQGECKTKGIPAADGTGCYITDTKEKGVSSCHF